MTACYRFNNGFNNVELQPAERLLRVDGNAVAVGARAFDLLLALIERHDRVVRKDELLELVWPGLVVEENNLQVQVSALRKLLGATTITTVAGRGYRFTATLHGTPESPAPTAAALPIQTTAAGSSVVLLFTDIVDSTRIHTAVGDGAMARVWQEHDRLARDLVRQWSGREIGRSDGFLLLFASVSDAVGFALAYHQALRGLPVPLAARVGIHRGPATARENSSADREQGATPYEVDGMALPMAARTMTVASGGQTLLSGDAARALVVTAPWRLQSHGFWQFKGLNDAVELFEVGTDAAPFTPPPDSDKAHRVVRLNDLWLPRRDVPHSLPVERDAFVGRVAALQALAGRFDGGARLVSVLGTGGTGKTRLATHFGWSRLGDFAGGVWFCDLSQALGVDGIVQAVAHGLQVPLGQADPVSQLASALAGRGPCLLVLDNFEQVTRHARDTLGHWLDHAPLARFLVTTRETLGLPGEALLALAPMDVEDGVDLFVARANAVRAGTADDAADHATVQQLVALLDGLPLAIELAAARTVALSPRLLLQQMDQRFRLLSSSGFGRQARHSTLRKTIDWSWGLLSACDRSALAQLSVFEGGWTLAAAEAVLALPGAEGLETESGADADADTDAPWTIDVLQSLVQKSLVGMGGNGRFELLRSIQDYAAEHLAKEGRFPGSGAVCAAGAEARHFRYFAAMDEQAAVVQRCVEIDNLQLACRRAAAHGDTTAAIGALVGAWAALKLRGPFGSGIALADVVQAMPGLQPADRAVTDWVAGSALYSLGRSAQARERLDAGLAAAREAGDAKQQARLFCALGEWLTTAGQGHEALRCLEEALVLAKTVSDTTLQFRALNGLGGATYRLAHMQAAQGYYESALTLARAQADLRWQGGLLGNLGGIWHAQGRLDLARPCYEQALDLSRQSGDRRWEGNNLCNLGLLHHDQGRHEDAIVQFQAALKAARELGNPRLEATVLCNLGVATEGQNRLDIALGYQEQAVASAEAQGDRRAEGHFRAYLGCLYTKLGREREARECLLFGERLLLEAGDELSLGVLLCRLAELEFASSNQPLALELLQRATTLAAANNAEAESELGRELEACRRCLR